MPPVELHSIDSFCAWLDGAFITTLPFGLSARLRPLLTSRGATPSGSIILVRPHAGHVLLSLIQEYKAGTTSDTAKRNAATSAASVKGRSTQRNSVKSPAAALIYGQELFDFTPAMKFTTSVSSSCINTDQRSYPSILQTLLQLTRSDGMWGSVSLSSCFSFTSAGFGSPAVDGVGRKLCLYAALLRHCAQWWKPTCKGGVDEASLRPQLHSLEGRSSRPFLFFESAVVTVPLSREYGSSDYNAQRSLLRVLRRLSQRGGWCLRKTTPQLVDKPKENWNDWLDYVVQQAVQCDLHPSGDYSNLVQMDSSTSPWSSFVKFTGEVQVPDTELVFSEAVVSINVVRAVLWHVLATEVDGDVLALLCCLATEFVCGASAAVTKREKQQSECEGTSNTQRERYVPLSQVQFALRRLVREPAYAFACCPSAGADVSDDGPSSSAPQSLVTGPLALSRLLSPDVFLAPFSTEHATFSTVSPRFFLHGARIFHADDVVRRAPLRVLLLRVDPEGSWLPTPEELASQRSFHTSYQRQFKGDDGGNALRSLKEDDDESEADTEHFTLFKERFVGRSDLASHTLMSPTATGSVSSINRSDGHFPVEDVAVSLLTARVLQQPPFNQIAAKANVRDQHIWSATVRLYVSALVCGVRVIVTPEKLPALTKSFGYRHLRQLHRTFCDLKSSWGGSEGTCANGMSIDDGCDAALLHSVRALLVSACAREPPVAIYLVDQIELRAFERLQEKASRHAAVDNVRVSRHPLLPVVLCRDVLRHSALSHERLSTTSAITKHTDVASLQSFTAGTLQGVFHVSHCCVLDEEVVCRTWARFPSNSDADTIMEACAGAEQVFLPNRHNVFLAAFAPPCVTSVEIGDREKGFRAEENDVLQDDSAHRWPSILLVAPTHVHAVHYIGLLRKAAFALLDALPVSHATDSNNGAPQVGEQLHGVVRGGGAFYISIAKQLRLLLQHLQSAVSTATPSTRFPSLYHDSGRSIQFLESEMPARDRPWVCYVLYLLAEACAAVATKHAEPLMAHTACNVASCTPTRGPRALRQLWLEVLRETVESPSSFSFESTCASATRANLPTLHVQHTDMFGTLAQTTHPGLSTSCPEKPQEEKLSTPYEAAMRLFAGRQVLKEAHVIYETMQHSGLPFFEPLGTNVRAVRESLYLLLLTLSASM